MTSDDDLLIAQLRTIGDEPCVRLADYWEQFLRDIHDCPEVHRERLARLHEELRAKGMRIVRGGGDILIEHLEKLRGIAKSLIDKSLIDGGPQEP